MSASADCCPLCGQPLGEPSVTVRGGGRVHVRCAEQKAAQAWQQRRALALGHLVVIIASLLVLAALDAPAYTVCTTGLAWGLLHGRLHRRFFWHYLWRDLRRALRRR